MRRSRITRANDSMNVISPAKDAWVQSAPCGVS
jgi:hypothetical protein